MFLRSLWRSYASSDLHLTSRHGSVPFLSCTTLLTCFFAFATMHNTCINSLVDRIPSLDNMDPPASETTDHAIVSASSTDNQDVTNPSLKEALSCDDLVTADGTDQAVHADDDISIDWDVPDQHTTGTAGDSMDVETDETNISETLIFSAPADQRTDTNSQLVHCATSASETISLFAPADQRTDAPDQRAAGSDHARNTDMIIEINESMAERLGEDGQQHRVDQHQSNNVRTPERRIPTFEELYPGVRPRRIVLVPGGDLIIRVVQFDYCKPPDKTTRIWPVQMVGEFQVDRATVKAASKALATRSIDPLSNVMELKEDLCKVVGLWMRAIHSLSVPDDFPIDMHELRHAIITGERYGFNTQSLHSWYATWFRACQIDRESGPRLLYPCFALDHAEAFATLTKDTVYNTPHYISDDRLYDLHAGQYAPPSLVYKLQS